MSGKDVAKTEMPQTATVALETNVSVCERLFRDHCPTSRLLNRWELRSSLADFFGVTPYFLRSTEHNTVLPLGMSSGKICFFGGSIYSEHNGFFGPTGGERAILDALRQETKPIRLLAWKADPAPFLTGEILKWDVPYNQYWNLPAYDSFDQYLEALKPSRVDHINYLMRRFRFETVHEPNHDEWDPLIDDMMLMTSMSFKKRGRASVYGDKKIREAICLTLRVFSKIGSVVITSAFLGASRVGVGIILREREAEECVYLLNLYTTDVNDSSAAVLLSVIKHASEGHLKIDGLRGAFGLKQKYGFLPHPSYALVRDSNWRILPQADLTKAELKTLYGRDFFTPG